MNQRIQTYSHDVASVTVLPTVGRLHGIPRALQKSQADEGLDRFRGFNAPCPWPDVDCIMKGRDIAVAACS
jgi:hypothetical protein